MAYNKTNWQNNITKLNAANMNHIEDGIAQNDQAITTHKANTSNPHSVTAAQVGLGNVTNDKQIKGLASGTTAGKYVVWGADGYTVACDERDPGVVDGGNASSNP